MCVCVVGCMCMYGWGHSTSAVALYEKLALTSREWARRLSTHFRIPLTLSLCILADHLGRNVRGESISLTRNFSRS